jgi:hypothetical protein
MIIRKTLQIIIFLVTLMSFSYSQNLPKYFKLDHHAVLAKINDSGPSGNDVEDIVALGDTIWIVTARGLNMSTDNGNSWKSFYESETFGTEGVYTIGYDKYNKTFWASTGHTIDFQGSPIPKGTGLHYTTDNGNKWTSIPQPVDSTYDSLFVYGINNGVDLPEVHALPIVVTEQNVTYDIAFTRGAVWITSWSSGLRKSTDMGKTWQRVLLPPDYLNSIKPTDTVKFSLTPQRGDEGYLNYLAFSVSAVDDSTIFAGTVDGINRSTDNGISWQKFNNKNQNGNISGNWVKALNYNGSTNTLWAATWRAEDNSEFNGVSFTSDGGNTWNVSLKDQNIWNFGFKGKDVIAAGDNGPFRSSNEGRSWILPTSIYDKNTGVSFSVNSFYAAASSGNSVWLGSSQGLAKITETGSQMWIGDWKLFVASQAVSGGTQAYVYPNPFSPQIDEKLIFKYSTNGKETPVTIRIYDFGMNYVRTLIQNAPRNFNTDSGIEPVTWNGKDDGGNMVPNGVYFYSIDLNNGSKYFGKILVVK